LAGIVSEVRSDLPAQGLPFSRLSDLKDRISCDILLCAGYGTPAQRYYSRLDVSNRTAAVIRAFPDRVAQVTGPTTRDVCKLPYPVDY
jgi:hypothetical protein